MFLEIRFHNKWDRRDSNPLHPITPYFSQEGIIAQRAKHCGVRVSVWMRSVLLQAAQSAARQPSDGYLRIREPDGVTT